MGYPLRLRWSYRWCKNRLGRIRFYLVNFLISQRCVHNYCRFLFSKNKIKVNHSPIEVIFYITDRCNLNCYMCLRNLNKYATFQHKKIKDMDFDTFKIILDKFKHSLYVHFIGDGEPLLNKDIFKMIDLATRRRKDVILFTNGVLLDKENIKRIFNYRIYRVNISLYGVNEEEFASVARVDGKIFYVIIQNIKNLIEAKRRYRSNTIISISYICSKSNLRNMNKVIELANALSIYRLCFMNLVPPDIFIKDSLKKIDNFKKMLFEDDEEIIEEFGHLGRCNTNFKIDFPILLRRNNFNRYCPFYYKYIIIDAEGNVAGCCRILAPSEEYGNIFKDKDIYNTEHFLKMREIFLDKSKELPSYCRLCIEMSR